MTQNFLKILKKWPKNFEKKIPKNFEKMTEKFRKK